MSISLWHIIFGRPAQPADAHMDVCEDAYHPSPTMR
jgi:hypothetical protein